MDQELWPCNPVLNFSFIFYIKKNGAEIKESPLGPLKLRKQNSLISVPFFYKKNGAEIKDFAAGVRNCGHVTQFLISVFFLN